MKTPLRIDKLVKVYGALKAVNEVSFEVRSGEVFGLLGPNGAGKTSILSTIVTLEKPTSGRVLVFDWDVTKKPLEAKALIGHVPQEIINHGYFTIFEIMQFHSGYYGRLRNQDRIRYLLERLALWPHRDKRVKQLSGGMKRRLLIAKALVHEPRLLLLDEPTAGVDIELRASLWSFVEELRQEGLSILLTTHYLEEAEQLCDRVGIIHKGQIQKIGDTHLLIQELTQRQVVLHLNCQLDKVSHSWVEDQTENQLRCIIPTSVGIGDLFNELKIDVRCVRDIQIYEGDLEQAFRSVIGDYREGS